MRRRVTIKAIINGMTFQGSTMDPIQQAVRDALIAFTARTAQAPADATKSAQSPTICTCDACRPMTRLRSTASRLLSRGLSHREAPAADADYGIN
jgi:hypothetical protein